jgi:putative pyrroloquinoline-quinone binding quinoprotein/putative pyrroloquinoline-quinone-binding quinoprotein
MFNPRERSRPIASFAFLFVTCLLLCGRASAAPSITLSKKSGPPTSRILVSGRGFEPNVGVDIFFDTKDEALVVTNGKGEFHNAGVHAPRIAHPGEHWVTALERNNDKGGQEPFEVETDWTQGRYDAALSGLNHFENVLSPTSVSRLHLNWTNDKVGAIFSTPAVVDGVVYFGSQDGHVYALKAATREILWAFRDTSGSVWSSPAVANGVVYVGSNYGIRALNAATGAQIWFYSTGYAAVMWPTLLNGVVYFNTSMGAVDAVDAAKGTLLWSYDTGPNSLLSPVAVADGVVYSASSSLYALNASTGALMWSYPIHNAGFGELWSGPVVANGVVYVGSIDGTFYALNASVGSLLWSYSTGDTIFANPAFANGVVYVSSQNGEFFALDGSTGSTLWRYTADPLGTTSPAVANGVVYVAWGQNNVSALDASTGAVLWQYATASDGSAPSVADGVVYVGDEYKLYAFDLAGGAGKGCNSSPPPKFSTLHSGRKLQPSKW